MNGRWHLQLQVALLLESVGVENSMIVNLEAQDITAEVVPTLSDAQLVQHGLTTLGSGN